MENKQTEIQRDIRIFETKKKEIKVNLKGEGATFASENHPQRNEDSYFFNLEKGYLGIFDGLPNHCKGQLPAIIASSICEQILSSSSATNILKAQKLISYSFNETNRKLLEKSNNSEILKTTATVGMIFIDELKKKQLVVGNAGDSRCYLFRDGKLQQLTLDDHEGYNEFYPKDAYKLQSKLNNALSPKDLEQEEQILFQNRNKITKCLGNENFFSPNFYIKKLLPGDKILFCTDGVSDNLTDREMENILNSNNDRLSKKLISEARDRSKISHFRSKRDDITAFVINIPSHPQ